MRRTDWSIRLLLAVVFSSAPLHPFAARGGGQIEPSAVLAGELLPTETPTLQSTEVGVTVTGTLVSAETGEPIAGGRVIILNPGVSPTGYADDPSIPDAVFADGQSDMNGRFVAAPPVHRQQSYGVIVIARGYLGKVAENKQFAGPEDPDIVDLGDIHMQSAT